MTLFDQFSALVATLPVAMAQAPADPNAGPSGPMGTVMALLPYGLMFLVLYFMLLRPQSKQRQEHASMLSALKKDDEVVTTSGMWGRIVGLEDKVATLEIADKVKIRILRDRIAGRWSSEAVSTPATQK